MRHDKTVGNDVDVEVLDLGEELHLERGERGEGEEGERRGWGG